MKERERIYKRKIKAFLFSDVPLILKRGKNVIYQLFPFFYSKICFSQSQLLSTQFPLWDFFLFPTLWLWVWLRQDRDRWLGYQYIKISSLYISLWLLAHCHIHVQLHFFSLIFSLLNPIASFLSNSFSILPFFLLAALKEHHDRERPPAHRKILRF